MKFKLLIVLMVFILVLPSFSQISRLDRSDLATSKIKINGSMTYYGSTGYGYLSFQMNLSRNGKPVSDVKIIINDNPNTYNNNPGTGWIGGSISPYTLQLGNKITIALVFKNKPSSNLRIRKLPVKIIVAVLKVRNIIKWVYPTPNQLITLPKLSLFIPFRWDFTGSPVRTELYIRDKATNTKIFSKIINGERQKISVRILKPGRYYRMGFWADVPIDYFKITQNAESGSKVKFRFCNSMEFKVKR